MQFIFDLKQTKNYYTGRIEEDIISGGLAVLPFLCMNLRQYAHRATRKQNESDVVMI